MKVRVIFLMLSMAVILSCFLSLTACSPKAPKIEIGDGLFCWDKEVLDAPDELFDVMKEFELTTLYQHIPKSADRGDVRAFLKKCEEHGIDVYLLTGDPKWGLDPLGEDLLDEIDRVKAYNRGLEENECIRGIMADVEAYLTDEWDGDPGGVMDTWADAMSAARAEVQSRGLSIFACIPYYLDEKESADGLKRLLEDGCDGAAIMNYFRRNEAEHIRKEMELLDGKPVAVVYELQKAGDGISDMNTYHDLGIDAVRESAAALKLEFGDELKIAFHHYGALKELMDNE